MFLVACLVLGFLNEQVAAFDESNIPFLEYFDNIQGVQISTVRYFDTLEKLNFRYIILTNHYINAKNYESILQQTGLKLMKNCISL